MYLIGSVQNVAIVPKFSKEWIMDDYKIVIRLKNNLHAVFYPKRGIWILWNDKSYQGEHEVDSQTVLALLTSDFEVIGI